MLPQAKLRQAHKTLMAQWDQARSDWDDTVSQKFGDKYIFPVDQDVRAALAAMEHMTDVLRRVQRDCE